MAISDIEKTTDISNVTVSAGVLSEIIGVSDRRIRQLAEENILVRVVKGRYKLNESVKNYILNLKISIDNNSMDHPDGELDLDEEKAIHEKVKRHMSELKLSLMRGESHKSEDVERVMSDMLTSFRARIMNLPSKLAPMLVQRSDATLIKDMITKEINEVLNELKDYCPSDFYSDEYIDTYEEVSD